MPELLRREIHCPYCGEAIVAAADTSAGEHEFIEDCPVCCRPIEYRLEPAADGGWLLLASRDDEA